MEFFPQLYRNLLNFICCENFQIRKLKKGNLLQK